MVCLGSRSLRNGVASKIVYSGLETPEELIEETVVVDHNVWQHK